MRGEYSDNRHASTAIAAIWLFHLYDFWNNLQDLFVEWYYQNTANIKKN